MSSSIRILIVDDHPVIRDGLATMLATERDLEVVGTATNGVEAVDRAAALAPHVVLLDLEMPDGHGATAIGGLRRVVPEARIIVFTAYARDAQIADALTAGASGYVLKGAPRQEVFGAIRAVHAGGTSLTPQAAAKFLDQVRDKREGLSAREREVLALVAAGHPNKRIAADLNVSERTVKFHVSAILGKLGAANRTEAVAIGRQRGLI